MLKILAVMQLFKQLSNCCTGFKQTTTKTSSGKHICLMEDAE